MTEKRENMFSVYGIQWCVKIIKNFGFIFFVPSKFFLLFNQCFYWGKYMKGMILSHGCDS